MLPAGLNHNTLHFTFSYYAIVISRETMDIIDFLQHKLIYITVINKVILIR